MKASGGGASKTTNVKAFLRTSQDSVHTKISVDGKSDKHHTGNIIGVSQKNTKMTKQQMIK